MEALHRIFQEKEGTAQVHLMRAIMSHLIRKCMREEGTRSMQELGLPNSMIIKVTESMKVVPFPCIECTHIKMEIIGNQLSGTSSRKT
jgi:hypothetical protein